MHPNTSRTNGVVDRRRQILELLIERGQLSIGDLSAHLNVSEMTVRRDLDALERERALKRIRGAAVAPESRPDEPPYSLRASRHADAKTRIGRAAANLVREGEAVAIDAGSTALAVAEALAPRRNITVVTPNLRAAWILVDNSDIRVIVTGGVVRPGERALNGAFSERAFEDLSCDTFFMGVGGVDPAAGFTEYTLDGTRTKQAALRTARRRVAVADASKLGTIAFVRITDIAGVDLLITDDDADPRALAELRALGLDVLCV